MTILLFVISETIKPVLVFQIINLLFRSFRDLKGFTPSNIINNPELTNQSPTRVKMMNISPMKRSHLKMGMVLGIVKKAIRLMHREFSLLGELVAVS